MAYQWYHAQENRFIDIETKCYAVSLPIALEVPALNDNLLIAYRAPWNARKWIVGHAETGAHIATGNTRKEAIAAAQDRLLRVGNEKFLRAIESAKNNIKGS